MLEVRNLCKIYKPKNGVAVTALDDVTLSFPETGMVFLLGKSGSGKSTLLNVCGGLDSPTSGEILVKGRSSKNFSQNDFDSYRNTFIGFIFQEYNILNEFSVEDNIALALELQNKPKDKAAVEKLLAEVDLSGYAKRKPNTLSGGQKQRIAIARALIKNPEIIMADEPSGALDSATGKQVFETLKKLSKDKLVIVVSHDRDFAEQYGDRIIELKDGKVISDVSKGGEKQQPLTENIASMGNILCIRNGSSLDEADFQEIKRFLKQTDTDVIITSGEKEVADFKKSNRITESGEREVFRNTENVKTKDYKPEDSKFIRSVLPLRHAIKIGCSGLKSKPVRLFFTVILCTAAFVLFGLLSTLSFYDSEATFKETIQNSTYQVVRIAKEYEMTTHFFEKGEERSSYKNAWTAAFTPSEIEELKGVYGKDTFSGVLAMANYNVRTTPGAYWTNRIDFLANMSADNALQQTINGTYPQKDNEICISSYMADVLINCQTYDAKGNTVTFDSADAILGKSIQIRGKDYTVTGIFDSGALSPEFEALKTDAAGTEIRKLTQSLEAALSDGLHLVAFLTESSLKQFATENYLIGTYHYSNYQSAALAPNVNGDVQLPDYANATYAGISQLPSDAKVHMLDTQKTTPAAGEALISDTLFYEMIARAYEDKQKGEWTPAMEAYSRIQSLCYDLMSGGQWRHDEDSKEDILVPFTDAQKAAHIKTILQAVARDRIRPVVTMQLYDNQTSSVIGDRQDLKVVGFCENSAANRHEIKAYLEDAAASALWETQSQQLEFYETYTTKYVASADSLYTDVFLPYDHSDAQTDAYWSLYADKDYREDDTRLKPTGTFINSLEMVDYTVKDMSKIFLYVGLVLAVFAALLFSNFISVSISQKKRDIGILRAVGAKSSDVFKIFFSESACIAILCIALSMAACMVGCNFINASLAENIGASLFVFGLPSIAILIGIAAITAIVATFLPVYTAARKKPIDSIRSL